jgi:hypothetical protein
LQHTTWGLATRDQVRQTISAIDFLLFIQSLNDPIGLRSERLPAHQERVPEACLRLLMRAIMVASC